MRSKQDADYKQWYLRGIQSGESIQEEIRTPKRKISFDDDDDDVDEIPKEMKLISSEVLPYSVYSPLLRYPIDEEWTIS